AAVQKSHHTPHPPPGGGWGVADVPRQIPHAPPRRGRLAAEPPKVPGGKPLELVWAMKDPAFGNPAVLARWQRDFPSANLTQVADANHYVQEDAPEAIAAAVGRVKNRISSG